MPIPSRFKKRAEDLVMKLMAIPGGSGSEGSVAAFVEATLKGAGVSASALRRDSAHRKSPHGGTTGNLIFKLPGTLRGPRRLLSAHMDTVPICVNSRPRKQGRRVVSASPGTGLGADDRAGVAAVLMAALAVLEEGRPHPPLTFLWTIQEEVGLVGARHVALRHLGDPKLGFNFDGGSAAELVLGATGAFRMKIEVDGIPAHAGTHPERGVSAIALASLAIADLEQNGWHGLIEKANMRGTSNVGFYQAGQATNVVTETALLRAEARSHNARFRRRIVDAYTKAFQRAARQLRNDAGKRGTVQFDIQQDYESFRLPNRAPCVRVAAEAVRATGRDPILRTCDGGLDANWLNAHGIPTVSLGCGQDKIHTANETLDLDEFLTACEIATRLAVP